MPYITISQLRQKLRPLVNARIGSRIRPYVDIRAAWDAESTQAACAFPDCDVRGLTGAGVERQWDGKGETIAWDRIRTVTFGEVRPEGDGSWYHPGVTYQVIQGRELAVAA